MKQLESDIIIDAKPEQVWEKLADFDNYGNWNPFIKSLRGKMEPGEQLTVVIQPPGSSGMTFKPTVLVVQNNSEFRWIGKLGMKGIFDGEHYFKLEGIGDNRTKFTQGEKFNGILVAFMGGIFKKTQKGFELMNEALKRESEKNAD